MSSKREAISFFVSPSRRPVISTFSRPESSGWKPAPSSSSAASRPRTSTAPRVGRTIPASSFSSVDFPEPFAPMTPRVSPAGTSKETPSSAVTPPSAAEDRERNADLRVPCGRRP